MPPCGPDPRWSDACTKRCTRSDGGNAMTDVLVVRRGGLGDTLLMAPLLRALRRRHPGRGLHFAGVREFAEILLQHGVVDRVLSSEDLARGAGGRARVGR